MCKMMNLFLTVSVLIILVGCSSFKIVEMPGGDKTSAKYDTTAVIYSKTFFQERFMGKEIGYQFLTAGNSLQYSFGNYDKRTGTRIESSGFEKLMGDFDVVTYFSSQAVKSMGRISTLSISVEKEPSKGDRIINYLKASDKDGKQPEVKYRQGTCLMVIKVSYGLGVRQGNEQIGFRKYYRPFIRVLGRAQLAGSDKILWQNAIIVFGENRYLGNDADPSKIKKNELIESYKKLTDELIELLVKNLNGEKLKDQPVLQGENDADNTL